MASLHFQSMRETVVDAHSSRFPIVRVAFAASCVAGAFVAAGIVEIAQATSVLQPWRAAYLEVYHCACFVGRIVYWASCLDGLKHSKSAASPAFSASVGSVASIGQQHLNHQVSCSAKHTRCRRIGQTSRIGTRIAHCRGH